MAALAGTRQAMLLWRKHSWALRLMSLAAAGLLACLPSLLAPEGVRAVEERAGDLVWRWTAQDASERRIVLVDIDERSLDAIGPWPWPRTTLATLIDAIHDAGVVAQALDIVLAEPRDGDARLRASLVRARPILAQLFSLDSQVTPRVGQVVGGTAGCPPGTPVSRGYYGLAPELAAAQPETGHITPRVAYDGVVRLLPAQICHDGRRYFTLALAVLSQMAGGSNPPVWAQDDRDPLPGGLLRPAHGLRSANLPGIVVPIDDSGNLRVPYRRAREGFVSVSAADILLGAAAARETLRGSIALVGSTAFGTGDTVATPLAAVSSGLEVHAQVLGALLDGQLPYTPAAAGWLQGVLILVVAALLLAVGSTARGAPAKRLPLLGIVLGSCLFLLAAAALALVGLWLPWFTLVLFSLLAALALATAEHALARAQRERLSAHLGSYLPSPLASRLMASEPSGDLQFETRTVSVLEASVRNFASLAGAATPEELAALLHAYCCLAVEIAEAHDGVIEHVVGDNMRILWNAEGDCPDHAQHAIQAARELVRACSALLASRRSVREDQSVQPLALGIGLESGAVIMGSYGPSRRRAHATLGDPVLLAVRLQQMTADLSVPILLGPEIAAALPSSQVDSLGEFLLEGLGRQVRLSTPSGWADLVEVDPAWLASATRTIEPAEGGWGPSSSNVGRMGFSTQVPSVSPARQRFQA